MASIDFIYPSNLSSYRAGETVTGVIAIKFENRMAIKGVKINLIGKGSHKFKVNRIVYYMQQTYFDAELYSLRDPNDLDVVVEPESYLFPLAFKLPSNIPGSFKGRYGSVEYSMIITIQRGTFKLNIKKSFIINVDGVIDLNRVGSLMPTVSTLNPNNRVAINSDEENLLDAADENSFLNSLSLPREVAMCKTIGCFGDTKLVFTLRKTGFVPGENIKFNARIFNNSSTSIRTTFRILKEVKYIYKGQPSSWFGSSDAEENEYRTVFMLEGPTIGPNDAEVWNMDDARCEIPALLPTNLGGGSIISVNYCAQLLLKSKSCGVFRMTASIPITIGTIPLDSGAEEASHNVLRVESQTFAKHKTLAERIIYYFFLSCLLIAIFFAVSWLKGLFR